LFGGLAFEKKPHYSNMNHAMKHPSFPSKRGDDDGWRRAKETERKNVISFIPSFGGLCGSGSSLQRRAVVAGGQVFAG